MHRHIVYAETIMSTSIKYLLVALSVLILGFIATLSVYLVWPKQHVVQTNTTAVSPMAVSSTGITDYFSGKWVGDDEQGHAELDLKQNGSTLSGSICLKISPERTQCDTSQELG